MLTRGAASTSPVSPNLLNCITWGNGETWKMTLLAMHRALIMNAKLKVRANQDLDGMGLWSPIAVASVAFAPAIAGGAAPVEADAAATAGAAWRSASGSLMEAAATSWVSTPRAKRPNGGSASRDFGPRRSGAPEPRMPGKGPSTGAASAAMALAKATATGVANLLRGIALDTPKLATDGYADAQRRRGCQGGAPRRGGARERRQTPRAGRSSVHRANLQ
mmetsp:Transcript_42038/g.121454  ORF Transcript_42038/g.121454 Transcript_42038/m.121454 type:complete len:220 (-) Transcript_42038:27-686(-)